MEIRKGKHIVGKAVGMVFTNDLSEIAIYIELWWFYLHIHWWKEGLK